jgi:hypothetical protein
LIGTASGTQPAAIPPFREFDDLIDLLRIRRQAGHEVVVIHVSLYR